MWHDQFVAGLEARNKLLEPFEETFSAFEQAASRAAHADLFEDDNCAAKLDAQRELCNSYKLQVDRLGSKLAITERALDAAQKKLREVAEEQYLRTRDSQRLHDEILALTMQLNLLQPR